MPSHGDGWGDRRWEERYGYLQPPRSHPHLHDDGVRHPTDISIEGCVRPPVLVAKARERGVH